jgi:hypothetical protein
LQRRGIGVIRAGQLPGVGGRLVRAGGVAVVGASADAEEVADPGAGVGAVVGEGFSGPVAGDEDAPAAGAEGGPLVDLALAAPGLQPPMCLLRLDAIQEPVGAPLVARRDAQLVPQPVEAVSDRVGSRW